jgi:peptide/nickel transport system permease protein
VLRFLPTRITQSVVVLFGVTIVVFGLIHVVQGDPIRVALGTRYDQATYQALRARSGLDEPLPLQYIHYLGRAVIGDLGVSFRTGQPVSSTLLERLPATVSLAVAALVIALLIAFPLGVLSATHRGSPLDHVARVISQLGVSIPEFWLGILLILLLSAQLDWLPPSGYVPFGDDPLGWAGHLLMPALTIGLISGSILTRFVRSAVLEVVGQDYIRTADAKGLPGRIVMVRHVLPNAMIPIITVAGLQLASLLGGVIVVEVVFAWPGLGLLTYDAVSARDYPIIQGTVLLIAVIFLAVNLLVDIVYALLDPRIGHA